MDDPTRFITLKDSMDETEMIIFDVVEKLLEKTGIHPSEVCSFRAAKSKHQPLAYCMALYAIVGLCQADPARQGVLTCLQALITGLA